MCRFFVELADIADKRRWRGKDLFHDHERRNGFVFFDDGGEGLGQPSFGIWLRHRLALGLTVLQQHAPQQVAGLFSLDIQSVEKGLDLANIGIVFLAVARAGRKVVGSDFREFEQAQKEMLGSRMR